MMARADTQARIDPVNAEPHEYLDTIFAVSDRYLRRTFSRAQIEDLRRLCMAARPSSRDEVIDSFVRTYYDFVKARHQRDHPWDPRLCDFIEDSHGKVRVLWGDCLRYLRSMKSESVQLMVTSPPYYNAREYSQWSDLDAYLVDMETIIVESYRVLDNHRAFVFNVGDIFDNDHRYTHSSWGKRRIPLGAYFTEIFERAGFQFVDDFIWDKGEVQSQRHKNGENPYPLYQYPINCYEHIFVFYKHRRDDTLYPCPVCGCLKVNGNAFSGIGVRSWECKNLDCTERSAGNRGKRFSARHRVMTDLKSRLNVIDSDVLGKWRRDIVTFPPVIKINSQGENTLGHTAPFPSQIPEYAVKVFTGLGETVLDPFAGSFTTPIQAVKLGRVGVGIELNKQEFRSSILRRLDRELFADRWEKPWEEYQLVAE